MSAPRTIRRTMVVMSTAVATGLLLTVGGPAAADPPGVDFDPCANTLQRAAQWPGELSDGSHLFSDGFASYLSRRQVCSSGN